MGSYYSLDNDRAFEKADAEGLTVVTPAPRELTVDIDSPVIPTAFYDRLELLSQFVPMEITATTTSKSGNKHVYLATKDAYLSEAEKIAIQAILGSDPKRELFSLVRSLKGGLGHASLMFEKPEEMEKLAGREVKKTVPDDEVKF